MAVSIAPRPVKPGHHHQRAVQADDPNHVLEDCLGLPAAVGFFNRLGVAVVHGGGEVEVVQAVVAPRQDQLARPDQPEPVEELGADGVGAGFATVEAQECCARAPATAGQGEHPRVLVVGMGGDVEQAGGGPQFADPLPGAHGAPVRIESLLRPPGPETRAPGRASSARHRRTGPQAREDRRRKTRGSPPGRRR